MRNLLFITSVALLPYYGFCQENYEVFVSNRSANSVLIYNMDGDYIKEFVMPGASNLNTTEDILFHPDGTILVTGFGNSAIKQYDGYSGDFLGDFTKGYGLDGPSKMSIGPDSLIYVTQWGTSKNKVVRFDLQGNFVDEFTKTPAPKGLGHTWDKDGNFYLALYANGGDGTVNKYDSLGNDLGAFINSDFLQGPTSIWFDENGDMLVEDWTVGKVLRYDSSGQYKGVFVTGLTNPEGIAFFPDGSFLIGDWGEDAIHWISANGVSKGYFTSGNGLADPNSVKIRKSLHVSVEELKGSIAALQVSPNAGSGPFHISFEQVHSATVTISIYDVTGKPIVTLLNKELPPGKYQYEWGGRGNLSAGMYFVQVQGNYETFCRKVLVH